MLKASNPDAGDGFGIAARSGDFIVVGAGGEDSPTSGINGPQGNNNPLGSNSGAAYIFERVGSTWQQVAYVKASTRGVNDSFGSRVSMDGDTIAIAAVREDSGSGGINGNQHDQTQRDSGAAYIFVRQGGQWVQQAYIKTSHPDRDDFMGTNLVLLGDTLVVTAVGEASASTGVNGDPTDNSADWAGAVYVFERSGSTWAQTAYIKASNTDAQDYFGNSMAFDGNRIAVGASREASAGTGLGANQADNSSPFTGAAYTFVRSGSTWVQESYIKSSNAEFGDGFGAGIALEGDNLVVGAQGEGSNATGVNGDQTNNSLPYSGAAYAFRLIAGQWTQVAYIKPSVPDDFSYFGNWMVLDRDFLMIKNGNGSVSFVDMYRWQAGAWQAEGLWIPPFNVPNGRAVPAFMDDDYILTFYGNDNSIPGVHSCLGDTGAPGSGAVYLTERNPLEVVSVCSPAVANSSTVPAYLSAYGSLDLAQNQLTLRADNLPSSGFGFFLSSRGQGLVSLPGGSQGNLCLGGGQPIGRHNRPGEIGVPGIRCWIELTLDLGALPSPLGPQMVMTGQTWYFQAWYRDIFPVQTSNFTDALAITF